MEEKNCPYSDNCYNDPEDTPDICSNCMLVGGIPTMWKAYPEESSSVYPQYIYENIRKIAEELKCRILTREEHIAYIEFIKSMSTPTGIKLDS